MSLVELLVGLVVIVILMTAAAPSLVRLQERSRVAGATNDLLGSLALARSEAVRSGRYAVVCPANAQGTGCRKDGVWSGGWLVFLDLNGNNDVDANERIVTVRHAVGGLAMVSSSSRPRVRYAPSGSSRGGNLTIRICIDGSIQSAIVVNNAGRPRVERDGKALSRLVCP